MVGGSGVLKLRGQEAERQSKSRAWISRQREIWHFGKSDASMHEDLFRRVARGKHERIKPSPSNVAMGIETKPGNFKGCAAMWAHYAIDICTDQGWVIREYAYFHVS
eukprot:1149543-Pelagomonas_calceolata.AAC.8